MYSKRRFLIVLAGVLLLCFLFVKKVPVSRTQEPNTRPREEDQQREVIDAVRRGGLKEAARLKGHYVGTRRTSTWLKYDLESLTKNSTYVMVGTPIHSEARLSSDGRDIRTDYYFQVSQALKGNSRAGEVVVISLPGGRIEFEDGTSAQIDTPDLEGMTKGATYVAFLTPGQDTTGGFIPVGSGQGFFEVTAENQTIKPHGHSVDPVQKYRGVKASAFLEEIRSAVKKYPGVSTCCH